MLCIGQIREVSNLTGDLLKKSWKCSEKITGDANRNIIQTMLGGGFVTNEIKLPDNWNELVAPLGYEPIENFYINGTFNKKETL